MPSGLCNCFICGKPRKHQRENLKLYGKNVAFWSLGNKPRINFCIKCHQKYENIINQLSEDISKERRLIE